MQSHSCNVQSPLEYLVLKENLKTSMFNQNAETKL